MRKQINALFHALILFNFGINSAGAYEASTHEMLTRHAASRSVLVDSNRALLSDLGWGAWETSLYAGEGGQETALQRMVFGARNEDADYNTRPFNHFFDPQYNGRQGRGLTVLGFTLGNTSPDWSLEDNGTVVDHYGGKCSSGTDCPQVYSFRAGQRAFWNALTGYSVSSRQTNTSLVFQVLGQVTHHIQDMAQPQHTRNDQHVHPVGSYNPDWSFYEKKTDKDRSEISQMLDADKANNTEYPIPKFPRARDFWITSDSTVSHYIGMAEFTSNNYTSYGTPFVADSSANGIGPATDFALPDGANKEIKRYQVGELVSVSGKIIPPGQRDYVTGFIYDELTKEFKETKMAAKSLISILTRGISRVQYVEDSLIYTARHKVLMPRAVAFSAGIINHFFRGRLNIVQTDTKNQWTVTNLSGSGNGMDGQFSIYSEDVNGNRSVVGTSVRASLNSGANMTLGFTPPAGTKKIVLAFAGKIGEEGDPTAESGWYVVAGKIIDYSPPPEISVVRSPSPMVAGQNYTVSYSIKNATSASYVCVSDLTGGLASSGSLLSDGGVLSAVANSNWIGKTSVCTYTATGPGGTVSFAESALATVAPALPCGQPISSTGSTEGLNIVEELGSVAGTVSVAFDAYDIPDGLTISSISNQAVLATTNGLVKGSKSFSFPHNPGANGTKVRVKVDGNSNTGTAWALTVSCPGQPLPGIAPVTVRFHLEGAQCGGTWSLQVDGKVSSMTSTLSLDPRLAHTYFLAVSTPTNCFPGYPYYDDNRGSHKMWTSSLQHMELGGFGANGAW